MTGECDHDEFVESDTYVVPCPEGIEGGITCAKCGAYGGFLAEKVYWEIRGEGPVS